MDRPPTSYPYLYLIPEKQLKQNFAMANKFCGHFSLDPQWEFLYTQRSKKQLLIT
jgi:hypothetical protein